MVAARGLQPQYLVAVVRHQRDDVVAHLERVAPDVVIADQDEIPGTGRAVACGLAALPADLTGRWWLPAVTCRYWTLLP